MAITFGGEQSYAHASASSHSFSFSTAGNDRTLILNAAVQGPTITGITYNGVAMTRAYAALVTFVDRMTQWYLANPATGSNTVALTYSGSDVGGGMALYYTGTDTADPLGTTNTSQTTSSVSSGSTALVTDTDNSVIVDFMRVGDDAVTSFAANVGQTSRSILQSATIDNSLGASDEVTTTAGSYTLGWSWATVTANYAHGLIEIHELAAAPEDLIQTVSQVMNLTQLVTRTHGRYVSVHENNPEI